VPLPRDVLQLNAELGCASSDGVLSASTEAIVLQGRFYTIATSLVSLRINNKESKPTDVAVLGEDLPIDIQAQGSGFLSITLPGGDEVVVSLHDQITVPLPRDVLQLNVNGSTNTPFVPTIELLQRFTLAAAFGGEQTLVVPGDAPYEDIVTLVPEINISTPPFPGVCSDAGSNAQQLVYEGDWIVINNGTRPTVRLEGGSGTARVLSVSDCEPFVGSSNTANLQRCRK